MAERNGFDRPSFERKDSEREKSIERTASFHEEPGSYVYSFTPELSADELYANPKYQIIANKSLSLGGFRAQRALKQNESGVNFLELQVLSSAQRESVSELFSLLKEAKIADIHFTGERYASKEEELKPKTEAERALFSLMMKQGVGGGEITAHVQVDSGDKIVRSGYLLTKDKKEIAFVPVETQSERASGKLTSLLQALNEYQGRIAKNLD